MHRAIFFVYNTRMARNYTDLDLRIHLCQAPLLDRWTHGNLASPHWRLYWNERAGASICPHGGERIDLLPERLVLIPPDAPFSTELVRPVRHLYIHFSARPVFDTTSLPVQSFPAPPVIRTMLKEMVQRLQDSPAPGLRLSLLALSVLHYALARIPEEELQEKLRDRRVFEAARMMRQSLQDLPDNATLAKAARMNTNAFIRLFREDTGVTPQAYGTRLRVEKACMLLVYTDKTMEEIADALGFCDRYHFSRVFSRLRGRGPAAFRREMTPAGQFKGMRIDFA